MFRAEFISLFAYLNFFTGFSKFTIRRYAIGNITTFGIYDFMMNEPCFIELTPKHEFRLIAVLFFLKIYTPISITANIFTSGARINSKFMKVFCEFRK